MSFDRLTNRNPFFEQMEKEVLSLIDPETGAPYESLVEKTNCPVCGNAGRYFLTKWHFTYEKCSHCGLVFVNPRLTEEATLEAYEKNSKANELWASQVNSSPYQKQFNRSYFKSHLDLLSAHRSFGTLLDIGCGNGQFLCAARTAGFTVKGVEVEPKAIEIARSQGLEVEPLVLTDDRLNSQKFDMITMFGVLEHLTEPARDMAHVHGMLSEKGLFMGITPNVQSLVGMVLHEKARFFTPRNHPVLFSFESIRYLFETQGFEILSLDTVLTGYDSIVNHLQYKDPFQDPATDPAMFLPPKLKTAILDKPAFEAQILEWDLGLRLRVIAQKR